MNLRGHFTSDVAELDDVTMRDYANDIGVAARHLGRPAVIIGWGIGALAALMHAERHPVLGLVLLAPSPPAAALPRRPDEHELRAVPAMYDADVVGLERHPRGAPAADAGHGRRTTSRRWSSCSTAPASPAVRAASGCRACRSTRRGFIDMPSLVIGAGLDDVIHPSEARRTADLLGAGLRVLPVGQPLRARHGRAHLAGRRAVGPRLARGAPPRDGGRVVRGSPGRRPPLSSRSSAIEVLLEPRGDFEVRGSVQRADDAADHDEQQEERHQAEHPPPGVAA